MKLAFIFSILFIMAHKNKAQPVQNPYVDQTFKYKDFVPPTSKSEWMQRKIEIRKTILKAFGDIPARPKKIESKILGRDSTDDYTTERFEFFNGVDAIVPGIVLIPKNIKGKTPAVLYHHYHGGEYAHGKDELFQSKLIPYGPGIELVKAGYIVLCIDAYAFGERSGKGPDGPKEKGQTEEFTWSKLNTWKGRSLWGMMVRDDLMALDYLAGRPEVDVKRIATIGLSLGCFRSFYVAALDDRIKVTVPVSCITRNADLIRDGSLYRHGIYYYVPGLLKYFDTESIMACIAPRALLNLSGADDLLEPLTGQRYINEALEKVYKTVGASNQFQYKIYEGVGHEWNADMWKRTMEWLKEKL
ncbi:MAG: alpha/beta hydrolase family protein [Saprospiraceae bacterium]